MVILVVICLPGRLGPGARLRPLVDAGHAAVRIPLFVSENIRLYGWVLFFIKSGVLLGTLKSLFGVEPESMPVHARR